jgi:hypothetical protein
MEKAFPKIWLLQVCSKDTPQHEVVKKMQRRAKV